MMLQPISPTSEGGSESGLERKKLQLKKACQDFEAILMSNLLSTMRENSLRAEDVDHAREIYESMMDQSLAQEMSRSAQIGLGEQLYERLVPMLQGPEHKASA